MYKEYINKMSEPIYNVASFEEFWAGQEEVLPAKEDSNWQYYSTKYATPTLANNYDYY